MTKPVRGAELRACIERVLEREQEAHTGRHQALVTRSSLAVDQGQGQYSGKVLVVEDNVVNQQVARRFLQRLGCEVVIAENGQRGVDEYWSASSGSNVFDLVLMDVQMPVMDGLSATRAIRARENGGSRVPIVALTASAMTDEIERCLSAGMDAVLAKPLELPRLCEMLDRYGLRRGGSESAEGATSSDVAATSSLADLAQPAQKPVDLDELRTMVGDDPEFMSELCETFVTSSGRIVEELTRALSAGDRAVLSAMAHKLKGGSTSICAHELARLAASLERDARERPIPELQQTVDSLRRAFDDAADYVTAEMAA
jgi:CheY-like chemotaxis protein